MKKIIIGFMVAGVLTGAFLLGPFSDNFAAGQGESGEFPDGDGSAGEPGIGALISALKKAGAEIEDEDISRFYNLLVSEYNLEESSLNNSPGGTLAGALPDINHIVRKAIGLPLIEAGKNIRDKEIAEFYNDFLKDTGWDID